MKDLGKIVDDKKTERFFWCHLAAALALWMGLYCILNSELFLTGLIDSVFGQERAGVYAGTYMTGSMFSSMLIYGREFLLGYALVFAVSICFAKTYGDTKRAIRIVILFEIGIELYLFLSHMTDSVSIRSFLATLTGNLCALLVIMARERAIV